MIKRLIGFLVTVAVLAVVVLTFLRHDRFRSMLHFGESSEQPFVVSDPLPAPVPTEELPVPADPAVPEVRDTALLSNPSDTLSSEIPDSIPRL